MRALSHPTSRRIRLFPVVATLVAVLGVSLLMLVSAPRALACPVCISPDKVTVSGDGISGVASITDVMVISSLGAGNFMGFNQPAPVAAPTHTGSGYELTRYFNNSGVPASFWTLGFDHMRYYPGVSGQPGYVYYEGPISDEASQYAQNLDMPASGRWYQLSSSENEILRQLLAAAHANPSTTNSVSAPPPFTSPSSPAPPAILSALSRLSLPVAILMVCLCALLALVGYRLAYSHRHPAAFTPVDETAD